MPDTWRSFRTSAGISPDGVGGLITTESDGGGAREPVTADRERGWGGILPALIFFLLVPAIGELRVIFPIEQTILLVGPAITACAVIAWLEGGRTWLAAIWLALSAWMLAQPLTGTGEYDFLARGWAILLAASFGVACVTSSRRSFFPRALAGLALTFGLSGAIVVASNVSSSRVQRTLGDEIDRRMAISSADLEAALSSPEWQRFREEHASAAKLLDDGEAFWRRMPDYTSVLFPSLLALESLAALALAWGLFHRISRIRVGPPLSRLREFRFGDQLVWGLLAGLAIVVTPSLEGMRAFGYNLLLFFGALYALRGVAVITWILTPRRLALVLLVILGIVFWPFMLPIALGLGIGDTWLDWRSRLRQLP